MDSLRRWFRSLFLSSDHVFYLAFFRVFAAFVICCKILLLWSSLNFLHGPAGLFETSDKLTFNLIPVSLAQDNIHLFYAVFASTAMLMAFGIGRRLSVAAVIVCVEIHNDLNWLLLDGGDNLLQFSLLYLLFADSFRYFCLSKSAPSEKKYAISHLLTNVAVGFIIAHICLVYMISGLSKAHAEVWYNGTAMYYILLGDRFQGTESLNEFLGKNMLFNVVVCYTTIVWESTFPFAVFVRRMRIPVLLMGVAMHLSIFGLMMIQSFQLIYISHYGFFFTDRELLNAVARLKALVGFGKNTVSAETEVQTAG